MATTPKDWPPHVSLFTNHEEKKIEVLVMGLNGSLSLVLHADGPTIAVRDPTRGQLRYKAVCELLANGHLKGWFVAHKGATPREDTLVFFPVRKKGRKPLPTAQRAKK
jgi:hypothetical protein